MKVITIILLAVFIATAVTAQANKQALSKKISITAKEVSVDSLLKIFSQQTTLEFSFNSNRISPSRKVLVPKESITLSAWLILLQQKLGAGHKVLENHIILVDNSKPGKFAAGRKGNPRQLSKPAKQTKNNATPRLNPRATTSNTREHQPSSSDQVYSTGKVVPVITPQLPLPTSHKQPGTTALKAAESQIDKPNTIAGQQAPGAKPAGNLRADQENEARETNGDHALQLVAGWSRHGSGDMRGIIFGAEYIRYYTKRFSLNYHFRGGINSSKDAMFYQPPGSGSYNDASIRFTTAGVQLGVNAGFSPVRTLRHEFRISAGPFIRYQSESNTDGYSIYQTSISGIPGPVVQYNNRTPHERFAVGGLVQFEYNFTFKKIYIGPLAGFQFDSDGNTIPQLALVIGRRL